MNQHALRVVPDTGLAPFTEHNSTTDGLGPVLSAVSEPAADEVLQGRLDSLIERTTLDSNDPVTVESARVLELAERVERNRANQSTSDLTIRLSELLLLPTTDLFPQSRALIDETLSELLPILDVQTKKQISNRVAGLGEAPSRVLHKLLLDDIAVARPILNKRKDIPDHVMLDVVKRGAKDHRVAIAGMRHLSGVVAHALVETDDIDIIKTVLKNKRVALEPETVDIILTRSKYTADYRLLLVEREDFTPSQAFHLFWWADSNTRLRILSRFALSRETIQRALHDLVSAIKDNTAGTGVGEQIDNALSLVYGEGEVPERKAENLLPLIQEEGADTFLVEMARLLEVSERTLARVRADTMGEPLAIFCKAGGMRRTEFRELIELLNEDKTAEAGDIQEGDDSGEEDEAIECVLNVSTV